MSIFFLVILIQALTSVLILNSQETHTYSLMASFRSARGDMWAVIGGVTNSLTQL